MVKAAFEVPKLYFVTTIVAFAWLMGKRWTFQSSSLPVDSRSRISAIKSRSSPPAQYHCGTGNEPAARIEK